MYFTGKFVILIVPLIYVFSIIAYFIFNASDFVVSQHIGGQVCLSQVFPKRQFTEEDMSQSLLSLDLAPSAVILALPVSMLLHNCSGKINSAWSADLLFFYNSNRNKGNRMCGVPSQGWGGAKFTLTFDLVTQNK